jgi:L-asparaginase II
MPPERDAALLADYNRGGVSESRHFGHVAVTDIEGRLLWSAGDMDGPPAFFRSSSKPLQAIPLVESGAADAFGLAEEELAVACGSHSGEPRHVDAVNSMLLKGGLNVDDLLCAPAASPPTEESRRLALTHNCSGKHAGMLLTCRHREWRIEKYTEASHPLQQWIHQIHAEFCGLSIEDIATGVDGCSVVCFATTIPRMATAFARFAEPSYWEDAALPARATSVQRLRDAMMKHPFMVSGTDGDDTDLMQAAPGRVCCKGGAEGVWCFGFPGQGLGLAFKVEDGSFRPKAAVVVEALRQTGLLSAGEINAYAAHHMEPIYNVRGESVGEILPAFTLQRGQP